MGKFQADRLDHFSTGIFAALNYKKEQLIAEGRQVYNLSVGTPDFPPPQHIVDAFLQAAAQPENYRYSLMDLPELIDAARQYYARRFGVKELAANEIMSVAGTQEGMCHLGLALCDKGDVVLLPNPGYPAFEAGAYFGEAELYFYPLDAENGFLPRFDQLPEQVLRRTKYMVLSYPSNPVGAAAPREMYLTAIEYAKKYGFFIINDCAYSDIIFDGARGFSFLSLPGAKEVGAEFLSLSKSFNVTGARISFFAGRREIVDSLRLIRTQYDFGMFYPTQRAAIAALLGPLDFIERQCAEYQRRRDALCGGLRKIGWQLPNSQGTMFVFAPLPDGFDNSFDFCERLMDSTGVICTPGSAFGSMGEGYVRFALTLPCEQLAAVAEVIGESGFLQQK